MEPNCVSYNMEVISGSPSIAKCELNNSTHNEHPDDFKLWSNYNYRGSEVSFGYKKNKKAKSVCAEQQISKIGPIFLFLFSFFDRVLIFIFRSAKSGKQIINLYSLSVTILHLLITLANLDYKGVYQKSCASYCKIKYNNK